MTGTKVCTTRQTFFKAGVINLDQDKLFRVGDKLISLNKATRLIEAALNLRQEGASQQETATKLNLDRSFVSRLETVGEIRKGGRVAVIGFPLDNSAELAQVCRDKGLDFYLLLNNKERWALVQNKEALAFFNMVLDLVTRLRDFDTLILITSDKWFRLAEALLDLQIIHLELGQTPIEGDRRLDPELMKNTIEQVVLPS